MDQELTKLPEQSVGWDDVQAADQAAHRALLRVAGAILVEFGDDSEASVLSRTQLLEPLMDQIEQTRRARRRGRSAAGETTDQTDPAGV